MLETIKRFLILVLLSTLLAACSRNVTLHENLTEDEGNEVLASLLQAGIPAVKQQAKDGVSITVPETMSTEALRILQEQGLPRGKKSSLGEIFKKDTLISSPLEERARYLFALSQEIERTVLGMDGVLTARVHIVLPERVAPGEPLTPSSAAVFVKHRPDSSFPVYVPKVRQMVFRSIPGLRGSEQQSVTVVAVPAESAESYAPELTWLGPFAMDRGAGAILTSFGFVLFVLWTGSLLAVFMRYADTDLWPEWLLKIWGKVNKK